MTKDEFISYIRGIIDMENENIKRQKKLHPQEVIVLIPTLKLIEDALNKIDHQPPLQTQSTPLTENPVPGIAEPYTVPYQPYTSPYRGGEPYNPYYPPFKVGDVWCNTTNTTLNNDNINLTTK